MKHIIWAILLFFFQVLVLNHLQLSALLAPQIYFLFILLLPLRTSHWALLLIGFFTGLLADSFTNTPGMHAFTATAIAYLRYFYIQFSFEQDEIDLPGAAPEFDSKGMGWYMIYLSFFVVLYHLILFFIEWFSGALFLLVFQKAIYSSLLALLLIFIILLLFSKSGKGNVR